MIADALNAVIKETGYLRVDAGNEAVAAAALVDAGMGDRSLALSSGAASTLDDIDFGPGAAALALQAIDRVLEQDSELAGLWGGAGALYPEFSAWMDRIRHALQASR